MSESQPGVAVNLTEPAAASDLHLSIIIVNWNTREMVLRCLASLNVALGSTSLSGQSAFPSVHPAVPGTVQVDLASDLVEVIVVDNASSDGSADAVRQGFPSVILVENARNVGFAAANNQAIELARGRYVLLLNSDTEVVSDALAVMVAFLEAHPSAGAAGPRLLNADGSLQVSCHPMLTPWREFWRLAFLDNLVPLASYGAKICNSQVPQQVDVIKGACLLLRRSALDQVGLLDDSYFMYTEEVDLCYRLAKGGWQIWWIPAANVVHFGAASSRQAAQAMYVQLYRSKFQFYRKFGGDRRALLFKGLLYLAYTPRLILASLGAPLSTSLRRQVRMFVGLLGKLPTM